MSSRGRIGTAARTARAGAALVVVMLMTVGCGSGERVAVGSVYGPEIALHGVLEPDLPDAVWTAADPEGPEVTLFDAPGKPMMGADGKPVVLTDPTAENVPLAFRVLRSEGDWLLVQYPDRPNGTTAWVRHGQVTTRPVTHRIEVHVGDATVDVYRGTLRVASYPAAVGSATTPTPLGHFYVDVRVRLADATGPYGAGQLSVTGFSEVYQSFGGGRGQIAIHGTNRPDLLGTPVSNGCVRISNEDFLQLLAMVPTGTPVDIVA